MAFDSKKTILLEKTYLYVRASLGFQLEGTSTEKIPTNNGFYRFFVDNLQKAIGNSYVNILYDSQDLTLQCFCSDLYMDELMSSDSSAIEDVVEELKKNTTTIIEFQNGVSSALESNHQDNVALNAKLEEFESGVSSALASNHEDNVSLHTLIDNFFNLNFYSTFLNKVAPFFGSSSGNLTFGASPETLKYFLDVDKFSLYENFWWCTENINVRGSRYIDTYIDSVFDFDTFYSRCKVYEISRTSPQKNLTINNNDRLYFTKDSSSSTGYYYSNDYNSNCILLCIDFSLSNDIFSKLVFSSHSRKFSRFSYNDGDICSLYFYKVESCSTCCINQVVDVPLSKNILYFSFDCNLDLNTLKSLVYHFVTDVMDVSFTGEQLGLHYSTSASYKVTCGPAPKIQPEGTIAPSRLIRVYVSK